MLSTIITRPMYNPPSVGVWHEEPRQIPRVTRATKLSPHTPSTRRATRRRPLWSSQHANNWSDVKILENLRAIMFNHLHTQSKPLKPSTTPHLVTLHFANWSKSLQTLPSLLAILGSFQELEEGACKLESSVLPSRVSGEDLIALGITKFSRFLLIIILLYSYNLLLFQTNSKYVKNE